MPNAMRHIRPYHLRERQNLLSPTAFEIQQDRWILIYFVRQLKSAGKLTITLIEESSLGISS